MNSKQHVTASNQETIPTTAVDSWYAEAIIAGRNNGLHCGDATPGVISVDQLIEERFSPSVRRAAKIGLIRGMLWFIAARKMERILCTTSAHGMLVFLMLEAVFGGKQRRMYLVEFLRPEPSGMKAKFKEAIHIGLYRWLLGATVAKIQVMTTWEIDSYAQKYRLPRNRFECIAFPMILQPGALAQTHNTDVSVMASGRAACDWPTLFAAAKDANWRLTVVCAKDDLPLVSSLKEGLNAGGRVTVLSEIPCAEHQRLLLDAGVYALVLREINASAGQVRFARTIESGVPIVASAIRGLDGYLQDGVTGLAVPVGDASALRKAIDRLIADKTLRDDLRSRAYEAMRTRTLAQYVKRIKDFGLKGAIGG